MGGEGARCEKAFCGSCIFASSVCYSVILRREGDRERGRGGYWARQQKG